MSKVTSLLGRTNPLQRVAIGAAVVALVAGVALLVSNGNETTQLAPLYTDLAQADAASVTEALNAQGVSYELSDGGKTILVAQSDVYDLRLQMASAGLPKTNDGYALLDQQGITTSEFRQRTAYQRALEGELANTIEAIDGIETAVVHLALPDTTAFVDDPGRPTASVLVRSSGVSKLSQAQVDGIVYLVSSSVRDMTPDDVTVTDGDGVILHAPGGEDTIGYGGASGEQDAFETSLEASLTQLLGRVAGGMVSVQVNAELNMDKVKQVSERYTRPEGTPGETDTGLVDTEQASDEEYNGVTPGNNAVLGPDGAPVAGGTGDSTVDYTKGDGGKNYIYDKVVEEVIAAPGAVEKLSVAVAVDSATVSEQDVAGLEDLVRAGAGIDEVRGDQIVVTRVPFATKAQEELDAAEKEAADAQAAADQMALIRTALIAFVLLVAAGLAYRSVRRARQVVVESIDISNLNPTSPVESQPQATVVLPLNEDDDEDEEEEEEVEFDVIRAENEQRLQRLVDMQPEAVAQVLRTWLNGPGR